MFMRIVESALSWIWTCKTIIHVFVWNQTSIFSNIVIKTLISARSICKLICKFSLFFGSKDCKHFLIPSWFLISNTLVAVVLIYCRIRLSLIIFVGCFCYNVICDISILISIFSYFCLSQSFWNYSRIIC